MGYEALNGSGRIAGIRFASAVSFHYVGEMILIYGLIVVVCVFSM